MKTATIQVANAPCSWGVLEFEGFGVPASCGQVLEEIAASGYAGTELGDWGFLPTDPPLLRAALERLSLTLVGAFIPVRLPDAGAHQHGVEVAVRTARLIAEAGYRDAFIVLADETGASPERVARAGRVEPRDGLSERQWNTVAEGAHLVAGAVRASAGLRTVFHHHCGSFVETPLEIDALLSRTDPSLLGLCLDTGHAAFGGGDPVALLSRHRERIWHVHLKDCDPAVRDRSRTESWDYFASVRNGVFCELGRGAVDFPGVVKALTASGYSGWFVVEQDVLPSLGTPLESARRNREYLASLGL